MNKLVTISAFIDNEEKKVLGKVKEYEDNTMLLKSTPSMTFVVNDSWDRIIKYNLFLTQPLTLSMFVPCDEQGEPMNEERGVVADWADADVDQRIEAHKKAYQAAKDKVLFEGWEWDSEINSVIKGEYQAYVTSLGRFMFNDGETGTAKYYTLADLADATIDNPLTLTK